MSATRFDVVRVYDREIVRYHQGDAAGKLALYERDRDMTILHLPAEATPMVFRCRTLTRRQRERVQDLASLERRFHLAFRYGVVEIVNLPRDDGRLETQAPPRADEGDPLSDDTLDSLQLGDEDLEEIGHVIYDRSRLGKGVPLSCQPLPSSQRALVAQLVLLAGQSRVTGTTEGGSSS